MLIHPELVAVFGECPSSSYDFAGLILGDDSDNVLAIPGFGTVEEACIIHPDAWFAVCRLASPILDLPINPIVYGCETGILEPGRRVAMVGFGNDMPLPFQETGGKFWAEAEITTVDYISVIVDGDSVPCNNSDLGSPLFVEYPDGSWHLVGISAQNDCEGATPYRRLDFYLPWIESNFGVDVSPCHEGNGMWSPGPECADLSMAGPVGGGTCSGTPTIGASETCGPGMGQTPDPIVRIDAPLDQAMVPSGEPVGIETGTDDTAADGSSGCACSSPARGPSGAPWTGLLVLGLCALRRRAS